jgi:hypothetical protein
VVVNAAPGAKSVWGDAGGDLVSAHPVNAS